MADEIPTVRKVRLWRCHRNPLMRRCDVVETVTLLASWLLVAVAALAVGLAAFQVAHGALVEQRESRQPTRAVLLEDTPGDPAKAEGGRGDTTGRVRWQQDDGTPRTATVRLDSPGEAGDRVEVWVDESGRPTLPPPGPTEAKVHAAALGVLAAGACSGVGALGRRVLRAQTERHRAQYWERAWARVEPQWAGRRRSG